MPTLLEIEVSPRLERSVSRTLTARFVEHWKAANPGGRVIRRDLTKTRLPFLDGAWIDGAFAPPEQQSPEMKEALRISDELIAELMAADRMVIGTPMYNMSIPVALKAYVDHIVRVGVTVTPRFEGCVRDKQATIIVATGSGFADRTGEDACDGASAYLKQIFGFVGISDVAVVHAGRTLVVVRGQTSITDFAAGFEAQLRGAARP